jgi:hypothetical protein
MRRVTSGVGAFETCRPALRMSASEGEDRKWPDHGQNDADYPWTHFGFLQGRENSRSLFDRCEGLG